MTDKTYRIVEFRAENIKRLTAVAIKPSGHIVEITGENGAGKTSVLDALWWCIEGQANIQADPIRKGADKAIIVTDLGELKVTRRFTRQDPKEKGVHFTSSIAVENADGAVFKSPQGILDALLGALAFDPLEFKEMKPAEQFNMLRQFVPGVDFVAIDKANEEDYRKRTDVNRRAKELRAQANGIEVPEVSGEPVDEQALLDELQAVGEANARREREIASREQAKSNINIYREEVIALEKQADELRERAKALDRRAVELEGKAQELEESLADAPEVPEAIAVSPIRERLVQARSSNELLGAAKRAEETRAKLLADADISVAEADALTQRMEERTAAKRDAIAKATMPIEGLGFGEGMVLLDDVPFEQASDAEQLRASVAIAMALNPKLKVIRIRDGSLLSDKSMKLLAGMAEQRDYQVWVETVNSDRPGAVLIEDGHVVAPADVKPEGALV